MRGVLHDASLQGRVRTIGVMATGLPTHLGTSRLKHAISLSDRWTQPAAEPMVTPGPADYAASNAVTSRQKSGQGIAD
eukprot:6699152-Prymnesium_polylepis.1